MTAKESRHVQIRTSHHKDRDNIISNDKNKREPEVIMKVKSYVTMRIRVTLNLAHKSAY